MDRKQFKLCKRPKFSHGIKLMEQSIHCPKCGSTEVEKRNHEQLLQKTGGVLLSAAGTNPAARAAASAEYLS